MVYREEGPWREARRTHRVRPAVALGCVLGLGFVIALALIEFQAAAIIVGLAVVTTVVLLVSRWVDRRHR